MEFMISINSIYPWALIFIIRFCFPPVISLVTILKKHFNNDFKDPCALNTPQIFLVVRASYERIVLYSVHFVVLLIGKQLK